MGISPDAVVIVATLRALKYHGGVAKDEVNNENEEALKEGINNLLKHVENIKKYGLNPIVAINKFTVDTEKEIEILQNELEGKVEFSLLENWAKGGIGAKDLAEKVVLICEKPKNFKPIYELNLSLEEKIEKVAKEIYGAKNVIYSEEAKLETHNNFIDIQIPLSGVELMGYTPRTDLPEEEYDPAKDRTFYKGLAQDYLTIKPGMFALFFPQDGHAPGVTSNEIKKLIVKVRVK